MYLSPDKVSPSHGLQGMANAYLLLHLHLMLCLFWHGWSMGLLRGILIFAYLDKIKGTLKIFTDLKEAFISGKSNRKPEILFRSHIYQINCKPMNLIDDL